MNIVSTYREVGTYRGAAELCGTTHKTVKRVVAWAEAGGERPARMRRARNFDGVVDLVAERVAKSAGRISAERLLPIARAAGYAGSARNFRCLVAAQKALWRKENHRCRRPAVWAAAKVLAERMGCLKGGVVANVVVSTADCVRFATRYGFRTRLVPR